MIPGFCNKVVEATLGVAQGEEGTGTAGGGPGAGVLAPQTAAPSHPAGGSRPNSKWAGPCPPPERADGELGRLSPICVLVVEVTSM